MTKRIARAAWRYSTAFAAWAFWYVMAGLVGINFVLVLVFLYEVTHALLRSVGAI